MKIRLYENLRTVSYTPFYLAEALGRCAQFGLDVETIPSPTPTETPLGLIHGRVDVSWGGPMRVLMHHYRGLPGGWHLDARYVDSARPFGALESCTALWRPDCPGCTL